MNRATLLSLGLLGSVSLWMLSGALQDEADSPAPAKLTKSVQAPMRVKVQEQIAKQVAKEVVLQGELQPLRQVEVKSQLAAKVERVLADKGERVNAGQTLVALQLEDRQARVAQANAEVLRQTLEVKGAKQLMGQGLQAENRLRGAEADLARALAELQRAELALSFATIKAPFDGVWEQRHVEKGSHLDVGHSVGLLVDNSVLKATGQVSQQAVGQLNVGQKVTVVLLDGRRATGSLTYIAKVGDEQTHSFRIEADIPNTDGGLYAGASAEIRIETGNQLAHFVSPSVLSLGESGEVGVKTVDNNGVVSFYPIELVRKDLRGVWVSGLPEQMSLITLGQGFVKAGDQVTPVQG